jgi:MFS transporter, Spinster family, sphingosine-1-phosphate transporter
MLVYAFNFMERMAFGLVLQDIKLELSLSDTQLGVLTGIASAFFFAVMGIPIARWADRGNRVAIIAIMAALQCAAVAALGIVGTFLQLLLIRAAVSIGEAGCVPPAHSLIADYFARAERPRAVARYKLGTPLAYLIGYFAAGWLNEFYGWRTSFVLLSLPGLLLAMLVWFTLSEPRRTRAAAPGRSLPVPSTALEPSFSTVCATLWANTAFRHLLMAFSVWYFFAYGLNNWQPAFFVRSHGVESGELGTWFAIIHGIAGGLGTYLGGEVAARYAAEDERKQLLSCAALFACLPLLLASSFLVSNRYLSFAMLALASFAITMNLGPIFGSIQTLVPPRMRAMSIALVFFCANLIGMGLGPLTVGALSDAWQSRLGGESLRYALVAMCPGFFWAAWHLWRASRTVHRDISIAQGEQSTTARPERHEEQAAARPIESAEQARRLAAASSTPHHLRK